MEVEYAAYAGVPKRNVLRRNGGFEVWQRDAGGAAMIPVAASTAKYTADGWYLYAPAAAAGSVWQATGIANGSALGTAGSSRWSARVQRDSGGTGVTAMYFGFPLDTDEIFPLLGQFLQLSFVASAASNWSPAGGTLACGLYYGTGAPTKLVGGLGYTGQTNLFAFTSPLTPTPTLFQGGSTIVLPITARQAEVVFWWTPVGTAGTFDGFYVDDVQLEVVGNVQQLASPFERLAFIEELQLCQRHFFKTFIYSIAPDLNAGGNTGECWSTPAFAGADGRAGNGHGMRFPVAMRVNPAMTIYSPVTANYQAANQSLVVTHTASAANATEASFSVASTGNVNGAVQHLMGVHVTADAGI